MSLLNSLLGCLAAGAFLAIPAGAAEEAGKAKTTPSGPEILKKARMTQSLQDLKHLKGKLSIRQSDLDEKYEGQAFSFDLTMSAGVIRFDFPEPQKETINLNLSEKGSALTRTTKAGKTEVPASLYGERVRQTAMNYEDLSMRFLYWPNSKVVGEELVGVCKCWRVRVPNPDMRGPYRQVDLWVDKESGAMVQMRAYNEKGKLLKEFKVVKVQTYRDAYILKQMRVETHDPTTGKRIGLTYLEIEDPD